ncbi:MarR family winged helix-turn-helix transcriptional regulator [Streptomyces sp. TLI_105]|uniref:MarR family winged helix-turn-helix transcriptional regulator n=1 Tax=Streptomyces sp. TLI_105 TaxID=1881019 RepID=UPI000896B7D4|nr:MarR family transcriptional regulator [Streptomyces sp. TLI_105]SEB66152.1 DNA-binding transcriptional regulator, MarR family [Streptomyces sp. TLI_105]
MDDRSPVRGLVHLLRAVTVEFDVLGAEFAARHGLHPTDVRALIHLLDAERAGTRATPGWLGEQLRLNSAGTTSLVDRLERLALVSRSRDTADRRRVLLKVEEKATELGWAFFGPVIGEVVAVAEDFEAGELETVRRFLTAVLESVGRARSV